MESEDPKEQNDKEKGIGLLMTAALLLFSVSITFIIILELFVKGNQ